VSSPYRPVPGTREIVSCFPSYIPPHSRVFLLGRPPSSRPGADPSWKANSSPFPGRFLQIQAFFFHGAMRVLPSSAAEDLPPSFALLSPLTPF